MGFIKNIARALGFNKKEPVHNWHHEQYPILKTMDRDDLEKAYCDLQDQKKIQFKAFDESHKAIFETLNIGPNDIVVVHHPYPYPFLVETNNLLNTLHNHFGYKWLGMLSLPPDMTIETIDAGHALKLAQDVLGMQIIATTHK